MDAVATKRDPPGTRRPVRESTGGPSNKHTKREMKNLLILAMLLVAINGCKPSEMSYESNVELPDNVEDATISFFVERPEHHSESEAQFVGSGMLASSVRSGKRRYFVLTASHVPMGCRGVSGVQIGISAASEDKCIRRLHIPDGGISWAQFDRIHGLAIGDITHSVADIERLGVKIHCIDLDALGGLAGTGNEHILPNVGVAASSDYGKFGIGVLTSGIVVCADPDSTRLVDSSKCLWKAPMARKECTLNKTFIEKTHVSRKNAEEIERADKLTVHELNGEVVKGNSGAPVYFTTSKGGCRFAGIVSGLEPGKINIIPVDYVLDYVSSIYGGENTVRPDNARNCQ